MVFKGVYFALWNEARETIFETFSVRFRQIFYDVTVTPAFKFIHDVSKHVRGERVFTKLDVGCGDFKKSGHIGIDLDRHAETNVVCDAQYLPFRDDVFTDINANQVLEHVESPLRALTEWKRVMKDSGQLDLCVPNVTYYRRIIRYILNKPVSQNKGHVQMFTRSEIYNLCSIVGFHVVSYRFVTEYFRNESISRFRHWLKHVTNRQLRFILTLD